MLIQLPFFFDNGTQGTINVKWPDLVKCISGGNGLLKYTGVDTTAGFAGINYKGTFSTGTTPGSLVVFGFPFETIYPQSKSIEIAKSISGFFDINTSVNNDNNSSAEDFFLAQNYPNPFNPSTRIKYQLPQSGHVSLRVYDILGKEAAVLVNEEQTSGSYEVEFNGSSLSGGVYVYQLTCGSYSQSKKLLLLK